MDNVLKKKKIYPMSLKQIENIGREVRAVKTYGWILFPHS
jgi:hypothetical protein